MSSRIPSGADAAALKDPTKIPEMRDLPLAHDPYPLVFRLAAHINGFPRHLSVHPGGIVIAPYPIASSTPLQRAAKGLVITQYDMYGVEDIGLVKLDLLAQRSLSVRDDVLSVLRARNEKPPFHQDPNSYFEDPKVREIVQKGDTMGAFYIESPSMRGLLKKLRVDSFEDLTAASSIIRPGVAESGMMQQYIRRKTGGERVVYLHPAMERLLQETFGVMIYQEDVIRVANQIGGMSLAEADLLRRAMSGKDRSVRKMTDLEQRFLHNAIVNDVSEEVAREIWRQISSFASYAFCKAHSASYAKLSLQMASLRAHYPAEFMAAVLSNQGGFYNAMAYVEEARRMGLAILLPDVRTGSYHFTVEDGGIRIGFMQVKDFAITAWEEFFKERDSQPWTDFHDFLNRSTFGQSEIETLIKCGACDSFGPTRPQLLWMLRATFNSAQKQRAANLWNLPLYSPSSRMPKIPSLPNFSERERLYWEMTLLDVAVSRHPLFYFEPWNKVTGCIAAKDIPSWKRKTVGLVGWLVTSKPATTHRSERMLFVTFEDTDTLFEVVFFPRAFEKLVHLITDRGPFLVEGMVEEDHGVFTINAERLTHL